MPRIEWKHKNRTPNKMNRFSSIKLTAVECNNFWFYSSIDRKPQCWRCLLKKLFNRNAEYEIQSFRTRVRSRETFLNKWCMKRRGWISHISCWLPCSVGQGETNKYQHEMLAIIFTSFDYIVPFPFSNSLSVIFLSTSHISLLFREIKRNRKEKKTINSRFSTIRETKKKNVLSHRCLSSLVKL